MMNIKTSYAQVTFFTSKKIGYNTNGERSVVLINDAVESLPAEASVSWGWFK